MKVHEALAKVMDEVRAVEKRDRNTHQNFSFRGVDAVVNAVGPVLRKHGVVVMPSHVMQTHEQVEVGGKRTLMESVHVTVTYTFYGPEGDHISCEVAGAAMDAGDKATPKAMSVAFRTALLQALCLPTDEPDPDSQTYERSPELSLEDELAKLDEVIAAAKKAGLEGDYDATREWAAESAENARKAASKLARAMADAEGVTS